MKYILMSLLAVVLASCSSDGKDEALKTIMKVNWGGGKTVGDFLKGAKVLSLEQSYGTVATIEDTNSNKYIFKTSKVLEYVTEGGNEIPWSPVDKNAKNIYKEVTGNSYLDSLGKYDPQVHTLTNLLKIKSNDGKDVPLKFRVSEDGYYQTYSFDLPTDYKVKYPTSYNFEDQSELFCQVFFNDNKDEIESANCTGNVGKDDLGVYQNLVLKFYRGIYAPKGHSYNEDLPRSHIYEDRFRELIAVAASGEEIKSKMISSSDNAYWTVDAKLINNDPNIQASFNPIHRVTVEFK